MRKTRIIATIGPATDKQAIIDALIKGGVDLFRLNFSHGDHDSHRAIIGRIRDAQKRSHPVGILQDIAGPKMRIGDLQKPLVLETGSTLGLMRSGHNPKQSHHLTLSDPLALEDLQVGQSVFFADGTIRTTVSQILVDRIELSVQVGGELTGRKGVNFPDTRLRIGAITPKDEADLIAGAQMGVDMVAISFVQRPEDLLQARAILDAQGSTARLLAKIERIEAVESIEAILDVCDGLMVARGDLGVEVGLERVPLLQKQLIEAANRRGLPAITATQMLTSMVHAPFPTRAEVSDVANAVLDGSDAVMLSDETAIGGHPLQAVALLQETIQSIETIYPFARNLDRIQCSHDAVAASAVHMSMSTQAAGIVVFSFSGATAYRMASFRPKADLLCVTHDEETFQRLSLCWGAKRAFAMPALDDSHKLISDFVRRAVQEQVIDPNQSYIAVMGYPAGTSGHANLVRLISPENIAMLLEESA